MTSYTKESNDLKRSVIQTKCKETQEETNEFMGWASQISKLNENTAFNLYTFTVKDRPQAVDEGLFIPGNEITVNLEMWQCSVKRN